ncbi:MULTISPECIES: hypothetical protein [unclassified Pseudomonas]|jgi:hypothetical protein|uniref:hypothetical protein n=1 Tax=unclassified Pseudomonas TaxID=196821 RepID=UPI002ADEAB5F|nr:hypothetical protein [Pseudomonas sp. B33.4]
MSKDKNAVDFLNLKVKEKGGEEELIPTSRIIFDLTPDLLRVGGFDNKTTAPQWGAEFHIGQPIKVGTYSFNNSSNSGFYNPINANASWGSISDASEITVTAVDIETRSIAGNFQFTVQDSHDKDKTADVYGNFSFSKQ